MPDRLRALIVGEAPDDVHLIIGELERNHIHIEARIITHARSIRPLLTCFVPQIIFASHSPPAQDAFAMLDEMRHNGLDIPVMVVSDAVGEEEAIALMKAGAADFFLKGRLSRLVPALNRELRDAVIRAHQQGNEEELRKLYNATSLLFQTANVVELGLLISRTVVSQFNYADCRVVLPEEHSPYLVVLPAEDHENPMPSEMRIDGRGLIPLSLRTGQMVYAPDVQQHPDYLATNPLIRSELVVPLRVKNRVIGLLDLQSTQLNAFSERDQRLMRAYAEHAAAALEIATLIDTVNRHAAVLETRVLERTLELQNAKRQVETILESAGDVILVLDASGRMMQSNQAFERFFGVPREGFDMRSIIDPRLFVSPTLFAEYIGVAFASDMPVRVECLCRHADGGLIEAEAVLAPILYDLHNQPALVCTIRDVTIQKQLEKSLRDALTQARELDEMKAQFISMVSHEFRTPLSVIAMSVQILQRHNERLSAAARAERLNTIIAQVAHLTRLAEGVIMLGRAERMGMTFEPQPMDVIGFMRRQIETLTLLGAGHHRISFISDTCPDDEMVGDERLLSHILHNLVSNAIKYSPSGSEVEVSIACDGDWLRLQVRDQGIGIPKEQQDRLFQLFYRASNVGTVSGSGLGLAIVRMAVEAYNGSISVESAEGVGTCFTVLLPSRLPSQSDS
jgi:PAS domain S-box-containing protein